MSLSEKYNRILDKYKLSNDCNSQNISNIIYNAIKNFVSKYSNPAIWCLGEHTKILMSEYMYILKNIKYIIDNNENKNSSGFHIISQDEIITNNIDAVIISSYKYRQEIINTLHEKFPNIPYLDIYQELEKENIILKTEYYNVDHPYRRYQTINNLKSQLYECSNLKSKLEILYNLIQEFLYMKDLYSSINCAKAYKKLDNSKLINEMLSDLEQLYNYELSIAEKIDSNCILMLCFDGLRRSDIQNGYMPKIKKIINDKMLYFNNAFSVSTSTFESLIPAYSDNNDFNTKYYECNIIPEKDCRFVNEALKQKRPIFFFTDTDKYINSNSINFNNEVQSANEKIWDFLNAAEYSPSGIFYLHVLYESHFSYPNPYTEQSIISEGTSILFDFLPQNGGKIRTNYTKQHLDALTYLDDTISPILECLKCKMVIFADHGNIIFDTNKKIEEIKYTELTFGNDLIAIPLAIKSNETVGICNEFVSLMSINDILINLMNDNKTDNIINNKYIKVQRSAIYNPDLIYLYHKYNFDRGLLAFECFVFDIGYKLIIYSDGKCELYSLHTDEPINDNLLMDKLYKCIHEKITVY